MERSWEQILESIKASAQDIIYEAKDIEYEIEDVITKAGEDGYDEGYREGYKDAEKLD